MNDFSGKIIYVQNHKEKNEDTYVQIRKLLLILVFKVKNIFTISQVYRTVHKKRFFH